MFSRLTAFILSTLFISVPALADHHMTEANKEPGWVTVSGTITAPGPEAFTLEYGAGDITVAVDGWKNYGEAYTLLDGESAVVIAKANEDFYQTGSLDASGIYVEGLATYFYADQQTRQELGGFLTQRGPVNVGEVQISGFVTGVDQYDGTFAMDTGIHVVDVSTAGLDENILDGEGYQQIEEGDYVTISGDFSRALVSQRLLQAKTIVSVDDNS